jgi:hypothetical protein
MCGGFAASGEVLQLFEAAERDAERVLLETVLGALAPAP